MTRFDRQFNWSCETKIVTLWFLIKWISDLPDEPNPPFTQIISSSFVCIAVTFLLWALVENKVSNELISNPFKLHIAFRIVGVM